MPKISFRCLLFLLSLACVLPIWAEEPQGVPPIRVVYFTPSDRTPPECRHERLGRVMKNIQEFYRKGMEANGHGPKTFALEWETPERLRLYDVRGQRPFEGYPKGTEQIVFDEVRNAFRQQGINIDNEFTLVLGAWIEWKDGTTREVGPFSGMGNMFNGIAFACDDKLIDAALMASKEPGGFHYRIGHCSLGEYSSRYMGGIAHELGHAFGVPHDSERASQRDTLGISLMGVGNQYYGKALRGGEGHDAFRLGKHDAFLSPASALLLSQSRAFDPNFTRTAGRFDIDQLDASFQDGKLIVTLKVRSVDRLIGAIAYNDNLLIPDDYDAKAWLAVSENPGEFRWEIDELDYAPYEMRLVIVFQNSRAEVFPIRYSNISGTPTMQAFSDTFARHLVNGFLDQQAWDKVAAVIEKQIEKFPQCPVWQQKLEHLETVKNPPEFFEVDKVPEEVKMVDMTYAKALEARVAWFEPSRGILRQFGFIEVDGTFFTSGIYAHADSLYRFSLGKQWTSFRFKFGVQDENPGAIVFIVRGDGKEIFRSGTVRAGEIRFTQIDVSGVEVLELITEYADDFTRFGRGLWLEPQLVR
ncbi:MAG: NPCBM/NEW2 domain-containing protein [Planctomycetaceae bacterium]|nr:NPCBM/NEW2 domain-containing protein [Planctomycetaceae bacterium]